MGTRRLWNRLLESSGEWEEPVTLGKSGHPLWGLGLPTCRMGVGVDEMACQIFRAGTFRI